MANTPKAHLVTVVRLYDEDSSDYIELLMNDSAPSGAADPWASAPKGSLHVHGNATDDCPVLYQKVANAGADDDWVTTWVDKDEAAKTLEANLTMAAANAILLRDSGQKIYSPAADTGALVTAASGDAWQIGDQAGSNYVQINHRGELTLEGTARVETQGAFQLFDDFLYQTLAESDTPWVLNKGSDGSAADPAIDAQECGVLKLTTGAGDGSTAQDGSQVVCHIPVQADSGGLVGEARLHINTAITNLAVNVGFTDSKALEEPFTIAAGDAITSTASDAACFVYDTDADTDEWFMCAVDSDTDDTGNATTGTAPTADTYQTFRIEIDSDGNTIRFYIDGTLEGTLTGGGISPDVDLYFTVIACGDGTASKTVDVDYIYVAHNR